MVKLGRPVGLIRYASLDEMEGKVVRPLLTRPRVWVYTAILLAALTGILYGLTALDPIELKVLHERAPLFATLSDGSIQNKYTLKILNKQNEDLEVRISAYGPSGMQLLGVEEPVRVRKGFVSPAMVFVRVPRQALKAEREDIVFRIETTRPDGQVIATERSSIFIGPKPGP
jgi:polyferredoxin